MLFKKWRFIGLITLSVTLVLTLILGMGTGVSAITNGEPDGDGHPYVCMVVFDIDGSPVWRTTGFIISPTVVVTAGHGTDGATGARIFTATSMVGTCYPFPGPDAIEAASIHTNPDYQSVPENNGLPGFDYHDVGVVILSEPVMLDTYAALPETGIVDELGKRTELELVGYGVQWQERGYGVSPYDAWTWDGSRQVASAFLVPSKGVVTDEFVTVSANPGQDRGGTAFGDSGGPILLAGTNIVIANNSFVTNANCTGVTYANRIDSTDILAWILGFIP